MSENNVIKLVDGVYHIYDPGMVYCTLIIGSEKALLFDTGFGLVDLNQDIKTLTNLPLIVVNSHGHPDHVLGNYLFESAYIHKDDFELYKQYTCQESRRRRYKLFPDNTELIAGFSMEQYINSEYNTEMHCIDEGTSFDLGGRILETVCLPGHTKGCIALFDKKNRILFGGDSISEHVWMFLNESTSLGTYIESLKKVRLLDFDTVIASHNKRLFDKGFVDRLINCAENIDISKSSVYTTPLIPYKGLMYHQGGEPFKSMDFVSIVYNKDKL